MDDKTSSPTNQKVPVSPRILVEHVDVRLSGARIFGSERVLKDISFELKSGDRLALIGRNGAGKSTLLKLLAGILQPDSGRLEVEGESSALFNLSVGVNRTVSGRRNMFVRNLIAGRSKEQIKERMPHMIAFADIGEYIDRPLEVYSQGMAMRTVFSAATEFRPPILLMDEWLGVGDESFRRKSRERMNELVAASGIIVLATHREKLSREVCNRGLYLDQGEIKFFGAVNQAWKLYKADLDKNKKASGPPGPISEDLHEVDDF